MERVVQCRPAQLCVAALATSVHANSRLSPGPRHPLCSSVLATALAPPPVLAPEPPASTPASPLQALISQFPLLAVVNVNCVTYTAHPLMQTFSVASE